MGIYFQVSTEKHNPSDTRVLRNPWFIHEQRFETLEEAERYARSFKVSQIIKSEVIKELSTYKCHSCDGEGIIRNAYEFGGFDECGNCEGKGRLFFSDSKNEDY